MAEINAGMKKAILDEIKRRLDGSPMSGGKPPTMRLEVSVKIPADAGSTQKPKSPTEQVGEKIGERAAAGERQQGNVWITQEAAKQGFYGGTTYAQQMHNRFVSAGMGLQGIGGALQMGSHYAGLAQAQGGMLGMAGKFAGGAINVAAIAAAVIAQILPVIQGMIKTQAEEAERVAKGVLAMPEYMNLKTVISNPLGIYSKDEVERAQKRLNELMAAVNNKSNYLDKAISEVTNKMAELQGKLVHLEEGIRAIGANAFSAAMRGEDVSVQSLESAYAKAGAYAEWAFRWKNEWEIWEKQQTGVAFAKFADSMVKKLFQ